MCVVYYSCTSSGLMNFELWLCFCAMKSPRTDIKCPVYIFIIHPKLYFTQYGDIQSRIIVLDTMVPPYNG